ncbi:hypothetical protein FOL47_010712 [Perkinsus chesapeaki]|uniref:Cilia- and flagella-associated protein 58 central coiled coil domain-containing protein n=1 Tax=Perkinsus chesapeaki TaxID=330153 RepID=A0A7J6L0W4_PERCH|nr:hypothetical protein FOL47_010712 [Perkinsus chesapeaki]
MQMLRSERNRLEELDDEIYAIERGTRECSEKIAALNVDREMRKKGADGLRNGLAKLRAARKDADVRLANKRGQLDQETRKRTQICEELKEGKLELSRVRLERESIARQLHETNDELKDEEETVREMYKEEERLERLYKTSIDEKKKFDRELRREVLKNDRIVKENVGKNIEMRIKTEETQSLGKAIRGMEKLIYMCQEKTDSIKAEVKRLETVREEAKEKLDEQRADNHKAKREFDSHRKHLEDLLRERDILNKNTLKQSTKHWIDLIRRQQMTCANLDRDIDVARREMLRAQKRAVEVEVEIEKQAVQLSEENAKYFAALEEARTREGRIDEVKKMIEKAEGKLAQQQSLYDAVCADRNLYAKSLIDCNAEIEEIKKKFKMSFHRIEQLKGEVRSKEAQLMKVHFEKSKLSRANDRVRESLESANERIQALESIVATQKAEAEKLEAVVNEAEKEVTNQEKELKSVVSERDFLTNQLSGREVEVKSLYEKIRLLESNLRQGDTAFNVLLQERRGVDRKLLDLRKDINDAKLRIAEGRNLAQQEVRLSKDIQAEALKCSRLQQELEKPMNVHRWRKLESSDVQTFERLKRVRDLQQQLIKRQEEVVEKEKEISAKESEFITLKAELQRQPGPEIHDQIVLLQQTVKDKQAQLVKLEMSMQEYREQCHESGADVVRLKKQMKEMNDEFIEKSRESLPRRTSATPSSLDAGPKEDISSFGVLAGSS